MASPNTIARRSATQSGSRFARVLIKHNASPTRDSAIPDRAPDTTYATRDGAIYRVMHTGVVKRKYKEASRRDLIRRYGGKAMMCAAIGLTTLTAADYEALA